MSQKKLMILGAGTYQVPLIKKAREMGIQSIAVSIPGNYPGFQVADVSLKINTTDYEKVYEVARELEIDGILTTGTDVCLPTIGYVAEKLGLNGPGFETCKVAQNKIKMKRRFTEYNVPTAEFCYFNSETEALEYARTVGFPVMVKAPDLSGSRGITKVNNESDFRFAWNRGIMASHGNCLIVEQFIDGLEMGGHVIMRGTKIQQIILHNTQTSSYPYSAPIGHSLPSVLPACVQHKAEEVLEKAAVSLGISDCVANADMIIMEGKPYLLEMTARMGGTCLPEIITYGYNCNLYEFMIRQALGMECDYTAPFMTPNAVLLLQSHKDGVIKDIQLEDAFKNHLDLLEYVIDVKLGDEVKRFKTGPDRVGHVLCKGKTAEEAEKNCAELRRLIHFTVE